jgi:hypothetical protein
MSENAFDKMKSDKVLEKDIQKATTFEDLRALLENATVRSGIAERNPDTGRFERRDPLTPAQNQPTESSEDEGTFKKPITIAGKDYEVTGSSELDLEQNIGTLLEIAANARQKAAEAASVSARPIRQDVPVEISDAVASSLAAHGFDVDRAAATQLEQDWASSVTEFLNSPAGADWPGGQRNLEVMGMKLASMGLTNAEDKVAALAAAYAEMKRSGTVFNGDVSAEQLNAMTATMTPQEIIESWKQAQPDADTANSEFIDLHQGGRFFGK